MAKKSRGGARPGAGRPSKGRDDVVVKIERSVAYKAKAVANHLGLSLAEVLSEVARAPIDKMYAKALREMEGAE